jgi:hypothetical protein
MSTRPLALLAVVLSAGYVAAAPAPAGKPADLPVPADALVVVQVNGVGAVKDRVGKFLAAALPDQAAEWTKGFEAGLRKVLLDRDLSAVAPDARVYAVVTSFQLGADAEPFTLLLPAADYKGFKDKFLTADERKAVIKGKAADEVDLNGKVAYLMDMTAKGYVAVTHDARAAETFAGKYDPLTSAAMGDGPAAIFHRSDAAVFVNLDRINETFGEQIRGFRALIDGLLQQGGGGLVPGFDKQQLEAAKVVYDGVFQAVEDGKGLTIGAEVRPDGLVIRAEAAFAPDTPSAKFLSDERPAPLDRLAGLPKGQAVYSASRSDPAIGKAMQNLSREFTAPDEDEAAKAAVARYAELATAGGDWVASTAEVGTGLTVSLPPDPAKLTDAYLAVLKALPAAGSYQNVPLKDRPAVAEKDQTHGGFTLHRATITLDFDKAVEKVPDENVRKATVESMKRLVAEKTTHWFGTDGKRFVQVSGKDWDAAKGQLDAYLAGTETVGGDPGFRAVRKELPADVSRLYVFEAGQAVVGLGGYLRGVMEAMPAFPGGLEVPEAKAVKGATPRYAGAAVVLKPGAVGLTAYVPAAAVEAGAKVLTNK